MQFVQARNTWNLTIWETQSKLLSIRKIIHEFQLFITDELSAKRQKSGKLYMIRACIKASLSYIVIIWESTPQLGELKEITS